LVFSSLWCANPISGTSRKKNLDQELALAHAGHRLRIFAPLASSRRESICVAFLTTAFFPPQVCASVYSQVCS